jgi:hypothetical protein
MPCDILRCTQQPLNITIYNQTPGHVGNQHASASPPTSNLYTKLCLHLLTRAHAPPPLHRAAAAAAAGRGQQNGIPPATEHDLRDGCGGRHSGVAVQPWLAGLGHCPVSSAGAPDARQHHQQLTSIRSLHHHPHQRHQATREPFSGVAEAQRAHSARAPAHHTCPQQCAGVPNCRARAAAAGGSMAQPSAALGEGHQ